MYVSEPNKFHVELEDDDGILTNTTQPDESVSSLTCVLVLTYLYLDYG